MTTKLEDFDKISEYAVRYLGSFGTIDDFEREKLKIARVRSALQPVDIMATMARDEDIGENWLYNQALADVMARYDVVEKG